MDIATTRPNRPSGPIRWKWCVCTPTVKVSWSWPQVFAVLLNRNNQHTTFRRSMASMNKKVLGEQAEQINLQDYFLSWEKYLSEDFNLFFNKILMLAVPPYHDHIVPTNKTAWYLHCILSGLWKRGGQHYVTNILILWYMKRKKRKSMFSTVFLSKLV